MSDYRLYILIEVVGVAWVAVNMNPQLLIYVGGFVTNRLLELRGGDRVNDA